MRCDVVVDEDAVDDVASTCAWVVSILESTAEVPIVLWWRVEPHSVVLADDGVACAAEGPVDSAPECGDGHAAADHKIDEMTLVEVC